MHAHRAFCLGSLLASCSQDPGCERSGRSSAPATARPTVATAPTAVTLALRSVKKVEQLVGDHDKHLRRPTTGQTHARFGVLGVDLGCSFEDGGRAVFLFGDTIGTDGQNGADAIGFTDDTNPDDGVALQFYTRADGKFLPFRPTGEDGKPRRLQGFEVPVAGIRVGAQTYVAYKDEHAGDEDGSKDEEPSGSGPTDVTRLARFDSATGQATTLCELSRQPDGKFQKTAFSLHRGEGGLPPGGPWVLLHGTGRHRASSAYLAIIPTATFAACQGARYWVKLEGGQSIWSAREADARPIFGEGGEASTTLGEVSVTFAAPVRRWIATYDAKDGHRKIFLRHAPEPWGPWSDPIAIFDPKAGGFGTFIHDPSRATPDGQAGPMIGKNKDHPAKARGGVYAPFVVERWTRLEGGTLVLYFLLSTWNPYTVVLMRADLATGGG